MPMSRASAGCPTGSVLPGAAVETAVAGRCFERAVRCIPAVRIAEPVISSIIVHRARRELLRVAGREAPPNRRTADTAGPRRTLRQPLQVSSPSPRRRDPGALRAQRASDGGSAPAEGARESESAPSTASDRFTLNSELLAVETPAPGSPAISAHSVVCSARARIYRPVQEALERVTIRTKSENAALAQVPDADRLCNRVVACCLNAPSRDRFENVIKALRRYLPV